MALLAVAGLSARILAEAAAAEGHGVLALDLFGDADTRRVAEAWRLIGDPAQLRIEAGPLCAALREARARGAQGWLAGSGFEADPWLLDAGAGVLPLIGNPGAVLRRVADPATFFARLDAHGLPHPPMRFGRPAQPEGWLHKDGAGCGGWRVRPAAEVPADEPVRATACWQRVAPGRPVSVTFVADGQRTAVLGFNQQRVRALPGLPYAFAGIVGPVPLPASAEQLLRSALGHLVADFGLRGLGSLDALLDGEQVALLELNPRPPASVALYPRCGTQGVIQAHLDACLHGRLPALPPASDGPLRGQAIVYAPAALRVDAALAARLAQRADAHDLPQPGTLLAAGDPLCSLSAQGADAAAVHARLDAAEAELLLSLTPTALETAPP